MHRFLLVAAFSAFTLSGPSASAQTPSTPPPSDPGPKEWYVTGSGEWIFSVPVLDVNGNSEGAVVRFSPFFNLQSRVNYDLGHHFGLFTGLSLRNLGFIYDVPDTNLRYKFRTYTVGVPVGIKVGNMNNALVFLGYELELPINYKEKRFVNGEKDDKFDAWISSRTEPVFHSVMLGLQGPRGTTLTFKYYLTNFHNTDFTEKVDGVEVKPYAGLNANIFYVSLAYQLFDGEEFTGPHRKAEREQHAFLAPTD